MIRGSPLSSSMLFAQDLPCGHLHQAWSWASEPLHVVSVAVIHSWPFGLRLHLYWEDQLHSESAKFHRISNFQKLINCSIPALNLIIPQFNYFGFWERCSKRCLVTLGKRRSGLLSLSMCMFCMKQLLVRCQMSKTRTVERMSSKTASEKALKWHGDTRWLLFQEKWHPDRSR